MGKRRPKIKVGDCPVIIGSYYDTGKEIVLVYGAGRGRVQYRTEDEHFGCDYDDCITWKQTDLMDFPNAKDPRLPYSFDLHYDIKYLSELKHAIKHLEFRGTVLDEGDISSLKELCQHHNIDIDFPYTLYEKNKRMILALIDTAKRTTDLENVYNDETGESFSWDEIMQLVS